MHLNVEVNIKTIGILYHCTELIIHINELGQQAIGRASGAL